MLYLNNQLLTRDRIIAYIINNVLNKEYSPHSKAPSPLSQLKNKLKAIFFSEIEKIAQINKEKRPSDEDILAVLATDTRFESNYPQLKDLLTTIFTLNDTDNLADALNLLETSNFNDWDMRDASNQFDKLNLKYGYFEDLDQAQFKIIQTLFNELAAACRVMIVLFEQNNNTEDTLAYEYAYKLMALFIDKNDLNQPDKLFDRLSQETYKLLSQSDRTQDKPFHNALLVELSDLPHASDMTDRTGWIKLIKNNGLKAFYYFLIAKKIEEKIAEQPGEPNLRAPKTLQEAKEIAKFCRYTRTSEDSSFASLCEKYKVNEERFNRCLDFMALGWPKKDSDFIPEVVIKGEEQAQGYYWVKLPAYDKRSLILGDITKCCQSIGGDSESCVKDAVTLKDNGLYVLLRQRRAHNLEPFIDRKINDINFDIVGQSYVWNSNTGNLCLDSIECLSSVGNPVIQRILNDFSTQILIDNPDIKRVNVGRGGQTPPGLFAETFIPEKMSQGVLYGDAKRQYCISKTPYQRLNEQQTNHLNSLLTGYSPEFNECINYLSDYVANPAQLIAQIKPLLPSLSKRLTPHTLIILLSLSSNPTIDCLKPVNLDKENISIARLIWHAVINPKDLIRVLQRIPAQDLVKAVRAYGIYDKEHYQLRQSLSPIQHEALFDAVKNNIPDIIKSKDNFKAILESIYPEQCVTLCQALEGKLANIIDAIDLGELITTLPVEKKAIVGPTLAKQLPELIHSGYDFNRALKYLTPEQSEEIYLKMKDKLRDFILSTNDFFLIREYLTPKQRSEVFTLVNDKLPSLLNLLIMQQDPCASPYILNGALGLISTEELIEIAPSIKDALLSVIKNYHFLCSLLIDTDELAKNSVIYDIIKDNMPAIAKTVTPSDRLHYDNILNQVPQEQKLSFYQSLHETIPSLVEPKSINDANSINDFLIITKGLNQKKYNEIYGAWNDKLLELIQSTDDLIAVQRGCSPEQTIALYESMKNKLPAMVQSMDNYILLITQNESNESVKNIIYTTLSAVLPSLVTSSKDFKNSMNLKLSYIAEQRSTLYEAIKYKLANMTESSTDFQNIKTSLTSDQQAVYYEEVKHKLSDMTKSSTDFLIIVNSLTREQRPYYYDNVQNKLPNLVKSDKDVANFLTKLPQERITAFYEPIKDKLPEIISTILNFDTIMSKLTDELRNELFKQIEDKLPAIIETGKQQGQLSNLNFLPSYEKYNHLMNKIDERNLIANIKSISSTVLIEAFAKALINNNNETCKEQFANIINSANQSASCMFPLFCKSKSNVRSITLIIEVLSGLESKWLKKINTTLELDLVKVDKNSVKQALEKYISANPSFGVSLY